MKVRTISLLGVGFLSTVIVISCSSGRQVKVDLPQVPAAVAVPSEVQDAPPLTPPAAPTTTPAIEDIVKLADRHDPAVPAEAREEGPHTARARDPKYVPAAGDELANLNLFSIVIKPDLKDFVEEEILRTKFDIPVVVNEDVLRWLEYYKTRGRKIIELGLKRIGLYRDMIFRIFEENDLPKDLIYIAQQESMFKPRARSRANAKGMWQFVYGTGKRYGLTQNWWIDEKLDPEKATRAAAAHLKRLYAMFGDWYLVMAAYNSGEYGMQRLTKKTGIDDFWKLSERKLLHKQTMNYVPSILATMIIAKNAEEYDFFAEPYPPIVTQRVQIPSPVDLTIVAEEVDMPLDALRQLNPELRRMVTPANQKYYDINLPLGKSDQALASLEVIPEDQRVRWHRHLIKKGDSLWVLGRNYGVSIEMIMDANNMSSSRIWAGKYIFIPTSTYPPKGRASQSASGSTRDSRGRLVHKVKRGDTLYDLARKYRTTIAQLRQWNSIKGSLLRPGDTLLILDPR